MCFNSATVPRGQSARRTQASTTPASWFSIREQWANFNKFLDRNPSAVVISSDWRKAYDYDVIRNIMTSQGFKHGNKIIGQTPNFGKQPRGREIEAWMTARGLRKPFVILDDRSDMAKRRAQARPHRSENRDHPTRFDES